MSLLTIHPSTGLGSTGSVYVNERRVYANRFAGEELTVTNEAGMLFKTERLEEYLTIRCQNPLAASGAQLLEEECDRRAGN